MSGTDEPGEVGAVEETDDIDVVEEPDEREEADEVDGRTRHYGGFYGVAADGTEDDRPVLVVHGNCQAESLRVLLERAVPELRCVRVPPVHELTQADLPHLHRLLHRCDVLVSQPVRDDYRGLPLGTAQLAAATRLAQLVRVPVVRDARLHPYQALVRVASAGEPPVVPYHDLRTLSLAAGRTDEVRPAGRDGIVAVGRRSQAELRRRETGYRTVEASDLLEAAGTGSSHTVNHPGNPVLIGLADRVLGATGSPARAGDPGRVLLRSVLAPLHPEVLEALDLDAAEARDGWVVDGEPVDDDQVRSEQLAWYREHPEVVAAGLERHGAAMAELGL